MLVLLGDARISKYGQIFADIRIFAGHRMQIERNELRCRYILREVNLTSAISIYIVFTAKTVKFDEFYLFFICSSTIRIIKQCR